MANITNAYKSVEDKESGLINNIQFFVMWRELEQKYTEQGIIARVPIPDNELVAYFEVFDDFNSNYHGVKLDDFFECSAMIKQKLEQL